MGRSPKDGTQWCLWLETGHPPGVLPLDLSAKNSFSVMF